MGRWVALTGTPGVGKSTVAALLPSEWEPVEVGLLALELSAGRLELDGSVEVDLDKLRGRWPRPDRPVRCIVGHLAHLLPVRDVVLLRCEPVELARRIRKARHRAPRARFENVASEAIDLLLDEALARGRRVWEVDTTGRSPKSVAREVVRLVRKRPPPRYGVVDWLSRRAVTDYLLGHRP